MQIMLRYEDGVRVEGILLAASREEMRVAVASQNDIIDLYLVDGCWTTGSGRAIEIEALIPVPGMDVARFCGGLYPRRMAAGGA
jgi:hypothetical protein